MSLTTCLIVMLGGAFGTLARYLIGLAALPISQDLPWGTIIINIAGSFIIGFFGTMTVAHGRFPAPETVRLFVMVGICGKGGSRCAKLAVVMSRASVRLEVRVLMSRHR